MSEDAMGEPMTIEAGVIYVYRDGKAVPKAEAQRAEGFHYWPDVPAYRSPMTGKEVTSRTERREEMKRHGVREVEPSEGPHLDGSRYSNRQFMAKHGIPSREE